MAKIKASDEFIIANSEFLFESGAKKRRATDLVVANKRILQLEKLLQNNFKEIFDYKHALDESSIIAITDQKGTIKKVNSNFCRISKYSEEELIGQDHRIINSGYHPKEFIRDLWSTIAKGEIWKGDVKNKAKDGTFYWVDTTIVPFINQQGKPYQYLAIRADITDRKETEEYLIQRTAQLEIANKNLLTFTFISSHDLQEPLRKIQTFISIILEKENQDLSDSSKSIFQRIQSAAERMQQLINDLLAFSRIATIDFKFEKIDLITIIEEVKAELKDTIKEKHAIIEATDLCHVNIIAFQFRQLIYNLISNALKFSQSDTPPYIIIKSRIVKGSELNDRKLSPENNYCHITITDNGIGFESQYKDRIFEMFQKLHKEEYIGTGIGLAIVKKIVDNHNGIIVATSALKKGATFDIYLPVY